MVTVQKRLASSLWLLSLLVRVGGALGDEPAELLQVTSPPGRPGGRLVVAMRAEPKTFNPVTAADNPSQTVIDRLMADLIHINRETQRTEAALAKRWTVSQDGRHYELELRQGLRFSDGHPLTAEDVLFTFKVHLDPQVGSPKHELLKVGGQPLTVRQLDSNRLEFTFAAPYAVGDRLFDSLAILPEHRLGEAYRQGRLATTWGLNTPPEEIVGLGPFRLKQHLQGERLVLERNPHYFKVDAEGQRLPYFDQLVFLFVANEDAQALRFQSGETQLIDRLSAESFTFLASEQEARGFRLWDLGPGLAFQLLLFNLNDLKSKGYSELERKQAWFNDLAFRRAIALAIHRGSILKLVYRGRATSIVSQVTPGNKAWLNEELVPPPQSLVTARQLLQAAAYTWDEQGRLKDKTGMAVEFSLIFSAASKELEQVGTLLQEDLRALGIQVRLVPLEFRAVIERLMTSLDYEACIFNFGGGDADPNAAMDLLLSTGKSHFWRFGQAPATPWEAEVDQLMQQQLSVLDPQARKALYDRVQVLVAENLPWISLVSPHVLVGARQELGNFRPAILFPSTLWNVDELFWQRDLKSPPR